jgi:hypothetical protein
MSPAYESASIDGGQYRKGMVVNMNKTLVTTLVVQGACVVASSSRYLSHTRATAPAATRATVTTVRQLECIDEDARPQQNSWLWRVNEGQAPDGRASLHNRCSKGAVTPQFIVREVGEGCNKLVRGPGPPHRDLGSGSGFTRANSDEAHLIIVLLQKRTAELDSWDHSG